MLNNQIKIKNKKDKWCWTIRPQEFEVLVWSEGIEYEVETVAGIS